jgi:hypothetical protein
MANFYGASFTYGGVASELYDLTIMDFKSNSGVSSGNATADINIFEKFVYRKPKPYFYGRTHTNTLEFDLEIGSFRAIPGETRHFIEAWLLDSMNYQPFQIVQDDIANVTFNVIFTKSPVNYVGALNYGFTLHGKADSPWGYEPDKTLTKTYSGSAVVNESFTYYNTSDDPDYNYPQISFTTSGIGNSISIINSSDSAREFAFSSIQPVETMTVDNYRQIISSSTGLRRMANFNKKFFRLLPGVNNLTLAGGLTSFVMTSEIARKIGA